MSHGIGHFHSSQNHKLIRISTYTTVAIVSFIILIKFYGWIATNSVTMLAALLDSLMDICISIMNLLTVRYSLQPPDNEHRFGHEKAEDIAVFVQATFFCLSGIYLIFTSILRVFSPHEIEINYPSKGIYILLFSIIATLVLVMFQRYVTKKTKSQVIEADLLHYVTDFLTNICAIIGIYVSMYWKIKIFDSVTASLIAIYIIFTSIKMFKRSFNNLMDREMNDDEKQIIIEIIKANKNTLGFHDLKTRHAGIKPFIQFHLELDENISLKDAHAIANEIEKNILEKFPNADIIIHQDPEGVIEKVSYKD